VGTQYDRLIEDGYTQVSIQLISPASGDSDGQPAFLTDCDIVSIQLISPASGDEMSWQDAAAMELKVSIQLISPASGDVGTYRWLSYALVGEAFPFN